MGARTCGEQEQEGLEKLRQDWGFRTRGERERKPNTQEVTLKTLHSIIPRRPRQPGLPAFLARVQTPWPRAEHRDASGLLYATEAYLLVGTTSITIKIYHPGYAKCQRAWVFSWGPLTAKQSTQPCGQVLDGMPHLSQVLQRQQSSSLKL